MAPGPRFEHCMQLFIMRHGMATSAEQDPSRPLTPEGEQAIESMAKQLAEQGVEINHIIHSPRLRTTMTAHAMAKYFKPESNTESKNCFDDYALMGDTLELISEFSDNTLIVGHMPFVAQLVSHLMTEQDNGDLFNFQPGTLACLEPNTQPLWRLNWLVTPNLF